MKACLQRGFMPEKKEKKTAKPTSSGINPKIVIVLLLFINILLILSSLSPIPTLENDIVSFKDYPFSLVDLFAQKYPPAANLTGYFGVFFGWLSFFLFGNVFCLVLYSFIFLFLANRLLFHHRPFQKLVLYLTVFSFFAIANYYLFYDYNPDYSLFFRIYTNLLKGLLNPIGALLLNLFFIFLTTGLYFGFSQLKALLISLFHVKLPELKIKENSLPDSEITIDNKSTSDLNEIIPEAIQPNKPETFPDRDPLSDIGINFLTEKDDMDEDEYITRLNYENVTKTIFSPSEENIDPDAVYIKPQIENFLFKSSSTEKKVDKVALQEEISQTCQILLSKLAEFDIEAKVVNVNIGPIITQYELQPAPGIKVNRFVSLSDDLSLAVKAKSIRVQAPIPGRGLIGIEIPNKLSDVIFLRDVLLSEEALEAKNLLSIGLGKDIAGRPIVTDLAKMPHLLIAGATGAGKSVCINTIITSLLFNTTPDEVRLVMIDPKRIELSGYEGIPHLIQNVVTDPEDAMNALNWAVYEMERRYEMLQDLKVRDISGYNSKIEEQFGTEEAIIHKLPYIIVIVDEFADLIMTAGREIEMPITRLAQMARAIGIHLILATQRPSIKVITGVIKANFPARIAFRVSSKVDSRVILDTMGAEKLLGRGDMLFLPPGKANPERIHGAFLSDSEIESLVDYLKTQPKPVNMIQMTKPDTANITDFEYDDELFPEAARLIVASNTASVSMLQRHFKIGYARAGRLVDLLERARVIGPHVGSKSRDVLMTMEDLDETNFNKTNM